MFPSLRLQLWRYLRYTDKHTRQLPCPWEAGARLSTRPPTLGEPVRQRVRACNPSADRRYSCWNHTETTQHARCEFPVTCLIRSHMASGKGQKEGLGLIFHSLIFRLKALPCAIPRLCWGLMGHPHSELTGECTRERKSSLRNSCERFVYYPSLKLCRSRCRSARARVRDREQNFDSKVQLIINPVVVNVENDLRCVTTTGQYHNPHWSLKWRRLSYIAM